MTTTQEIRNQILETLKSQDTITIDLENEWVLIKGLNSYRVEHTYNVQKWEEFKTEKEAVKYFMTKVSYMVRRFKVTKMPRAIIIKTK